MPSVFRTHFKAIGFPALLAQFGEPIVYFPRAGGTKPFSAIVERRQFEIYVAGDIVLAHYSIRFFDDCETGMQASDIDTGGDEVEVVANETDSQRDRLTVLKIVNQDNGKVEIALA